MARILVTGSRGTLGRPLVAELRRRGHRVRGTDLFHGGDDDCDRADVGSFRQVERVFEDEYDYVYHLAAEFGRKNGEDHYQRLWRTNVVGTRNILEMQVNRGFGLILAGSSEIYGDLGDILLDEGLTDRIPVFPPNDHAISKWVNELQAINFARAFGTAIVRLRIFNGYGPGETHHPYCSVVGLFCHHALTGQPFDVFRGCYRTFMYVDDLIPSLANVVENFRPGNVYNLGGRDHRSVEELAAIVLAATGADPALAAPRDRDFPNAPSRRPDITRAARDLGHDPRVRLEEGVPLTLGWIRRELMNGGR